MKLKFPILEQFYESGYKRITLDSDEVEKNWWKEQQRVLGLRIPKLPGLLLGSRKGRYLQTLRQRSI
jgi:hypothetical protein